jgi:hypothetical protein
MGLGQNLASALRRLLLTLNPSPLVGEGLSRKILTPLSLFGRGAGGEGPTSTVREYLNLPVYRYTS